MPETEFLRLFWDKNFCSAEIENVLHAHPRIREAAVVGLASLDWSEAAGEAGLLFGLTHGIGSIAGLMLGGFGANWLMRQGTIWTLWLAALSDLLGAFLPIGTTVCSASAQTAVPASAQ